MKDEDDNHWDNVVTYKINTKLSPNYKAFLDKKKQSLDNRVDNPPPDSFKIVLGVSGASIVPKKLIVSNNNAWIY